MTRTKLQDRALPIYSRAEECMNMVSHIAGGGLGVFALLLCLLKSVLRGNVWGIVSASIYGASMICLYTMSSIYHGLRPGTGKKVMQIFDHCTIYFLIAGTYTPIALCGFRPVFPVIGWGLTVFQWGLTALAVTLTAIDLKKFNVFSMICYIGMGWAILPFMGQARQIMTSTGFDLLLAGGISYTFGAVLYGIGSQRAWFHSVFHLFVVLGSFLQFLSILLYVL